MRNLSLAFGFAADVARNRIRNGDYICSLVTSYIELKTSVANEIWRVICLPRKYDRVPP
jgi:hypothetical protein